MEPNTFWPEPRTAASIPFSGKRRVGYYFSSWRHGTKGGGEGREEALSQHLLHEQMRKRVCHAPSNKNQPPQQKCWNKGGEFTQHWKHLKFRILKIVWSRRFPLFSLIAPNFRLNNGKKKILSDFSFLFVWESVGRGVFFFCKNFPPLAPSEKSGEGSIHQHPRRSLCSSFFMGVVRKHIFSLFKNGTSPVFPSAFRRGDYIFDS